VAKGAGEVRVQKLARGYSGRDMISCRQGRRGLKEPGREGLRAPQGSRGRGLRAIDAAALGGVEGLAIHRGRRSNRRCSLGQRRKRWHSTICTEACTGTEAMAQATGDRGGFSPATLENNTLRWLIFIALSQPLLLLLLLLLFLYWKQPGFMKFSGVESSWVYFHRAGRRQSWARFTLKSLFLPLLFFHHKGFLRVGDVLLLASVVLVVCRKVLFGRSRFL